MKKNKRLILTIIYTMLILAGSVIPSKGIDTGFKHQDKIAHAVIFSGLGLLVGITFRKRIILVAILWIIGCGALSESLQLLPPYREADWGDLACDIGGGTLGFVMARIGMLWLGRKQDKTADAETIEQDSGRVPE